MQFLRDIAAIKAGVPFRKEVIPVPEGRYRLVQIKDVDRDAVLKVDSLMRIELPDVQENHLLRRGDVLLVARGWRNDAVAFLSDADNVIAGSQLFIIRPGKTVMSEYLAWYLNQVQTQRLIMAGRTGSSVPFVRRDSLENLQLPLPPIEEQRKIAQIHELSLREQALLDQLKEQRKLMVDAALHKIICRNQ